MNNTFYESILEACSEFGATVKPVATLELTRAEGGKHPNIQEHIGYTDAVLKLLEA